MDNIAEFERRIIVALDKIERHMTSDAGFCTFKRMGKCQSGFIIHGLAPMPNLRTGFAVFLPPRLV